VPFVTVTRRLTFNAAHRVHNPELSDLENMRLFGKCNNPNWHGHNYVLEVSVRGPIDAKTGYVLDLARVKEIVSREIIDKVDHKNLNLDVEFMRDVIPTTENLIVRTWQILVKALAPAQLIHLRLWESENNSVEYTGE
jgi:6-pyruvoyltetrahydropterin/6-carboxytetrahydropterin synthase